MQEANKITKAGKKLKWSWENIILSKKLQIIGYYNNQKNISLHTVLGGGTLCHPNGSLFSVIHELKLQSTKTLKPHRFTSPLLDG